MNIYLEKWENIKNNFLNGSLVIGNGTSIEIYRDFDYKILHDEAVKRSLITSEASYIFEQFSTNNFEITLKHLARSALICDILKEESAYNSISSKYQEIRKALFHTIYAIHPKISNKTNFHNFFIGRDLEAKAVFLQNFRTIISLNYDLILYWITLWVMICNSEAKRNKSELKFNVVFKDCFANEDKEHNRLLFSADPLHLRENLDSKDVTLVFYPHGNLVLANDTNDDMPIKLKAEYSLIETINEKWESGQVTPLIVCEGETANKLKSIESNPYTSYVFHAILPNLNSDNLTILGWSLDKSDEHILSQVIRNQPKKIAISYYKNANTSHIQQRIKSAWDEIFTDKKSYKLLAPYPDIFLFPSEEVWKC